MKVFLDTNIWLRYFLKDDEEGYQECARLFTSIEEGIVTPYTSTIVCLEINYVLRSLFRVKKETVLDIFQAINQVRN